MAWRCRPATAISRARSARKPCGCRRTCGASATRSRRATPISRGSRRRPRRISRATAGASITWRCATARRSPRPAPTTASSCFSRRRGWEIRASLIISRSPDDGMNPILVSEVGPRDGLQSVKAAMPTEAKHRWIRALAGAGLREIEVASFGPGKLLPQVADAAEVVREAVKIRGLTVLARAPNLKGVENAVAAGAHKVTLPVSASHAHSLSNIRMTCEEAIEQVGRICAFRDSLPADRRPKIEVGLSTAFGCTIQGEVDEDWVFEMANRVAAQGADSIGLSDRVGEANPREGERMFVRLPRAPRDKEGGARPPKTPRPGPAHTGGP